MGPTLSYSKRHNLHDVIRSRAISNRTILHDTTKKKIRIRQQIYYGKFSERNVEQVQTDKIEYEREKSAKENEKKEKTKT